MAKVAKAPTLQNSGEEVRAALHGLLQKARSAGIFTCAYAACGSVDRDDTELWAEVGTSAGWFDLASITKALVTAPAVFHQCAQLPPAFFATPLGDFFAGEAHLLPDGLARMPVALLLQHRSGLSPWRSFWISDAAGASVGSSPAQQVLARIAATEFLNSEARAEGPHPYNYSDIGFILLGLSFERLTGISLAQYFYQLCLYEYKLHDVPLRFSDAFADLRATDFISSGYCQVRQKVLQGEVHDENAAFLGGIAGHAGAFATGEGLCRFLRAFVRSGLGEKVVKANAAQRRAGDNRGLYGWQQGSFGGGQCFGQGQAIGHLGFTGTAFWYVPEQRYYGVLLTNRVAKGRTSQLAELGALRQEIFSLFNRRLFSLDKT